MAILNIRVVPDPILRKKAVKVAKILPRHKKLAADMIETMEDRQGVGLAANQVGSLEKIAVIQTPDMEDAMVLVNPEITKQEGEREVEEGCLSVPGWRGIVTRSEKVEARYTKLDGKRVKVKAEELLAQALEHEIDHLNGIMYMDHLLSHSEENFYKIPERSEDDGEADEEDHDGHGEDGHDGHGHHGHGPSTDFEALHRRLHGQDSEHRAQALEGEDAGAVAAEPATPGSD